MKLISLEVQNFKKFDRLHHVDFMDMNIIIEQNGFGKTSTFQAILFALYGERPSGGNLNNFLNDPAKKSTVKLVYEDGGSEYVITRIIGGTPSITRDGQVITTSAKEINQLTESQFPKGVRQILVKYGSLGNIILDPSLVDELILDKKPQELLKTYKKEVYDLRVVGKKLTSDHQGAVSRLQSLAAKADCKGPEELMEQLNLTQGVSPEVIKRVGELKEKTANPLQYEDPFGYIKMPAKVLSSADFKMHFESIQKQLTAHKAVISEQSELPQRKVPVSPQLVKESNKLKTCQACNTPLTKDMKPSQDSVALKKAENACNELNWILENQEQIIEAFHFAEAAKELTQLERLYGEKLNIAASSKLSSQEVAQGLHDFRLIENLVNEQKENTKKGKLTVLKQSITSQYIDEQREILSDQIVAYATKILSLHYSSAGFLAVMVSETGDGFSVYRGGKLQGVHPVSLLSSGERTIVNFALLIAVSKIFPGLPVILDEPFGNLDSSNKPLSLRVAKEELQGHQLFLTNH